MKDQYTIGEVAKILGVTTKTLRVWDKEGEFKPDGQENGHRRYSAGLIEGRLGRPIKDESDPVLKLDRAQYELITRRCGTALGRELDFWKVKGDSIKEKADTLEDLLLRLKIALYKINGEFTPTFIVMSQEMYWFFECMESFIPSLDDDGKAPTSRVGTLDPFAVYVSEHVPSTHIMMGTVSDGEIIEEKGYAAYMWMRHFLDESFDPWEGTFKEEKDEKEEVPA
jgi:hypothetical protein